MWNHPTIPGEIGMEVPQHMSSKAQVAGAQQAVRFKNCTGNASFPPLEQKCICFFVVAGNMRDDLSNLAVGGIKETNYDCYS